MNKQVIKTVIGEKQQQIGKTRLLQRSGQFDEHSCYVLVGIRRAGKSYTLYQDMQTKLPRWRTFYISILKTSVWHR